MTRDEFMTAMAPMLEAAGFRRSRSTWHKEYPDSVGVFTVQASRWDSEYSLIAAIYVKALGKERTPAEYDCHLRRRFDMAGRTADAVFRETVAWLFGNSTFSGMRATIEDNPGVTAAPGLMKYLNMA